MYSPKPIEVQRWSNDYRSFKVLSFLQGKTNNPEKKLKQISKNQTAKIFKDFCQSTSLHGYSYLYIGESKILKLFWICTVLAATTLSIALLVSNTTEYLNAGIVTTIESSTAPLDVSTICAYFQ